MEKAGGASETEADAKDAGPEARPTGNKMIKDSHLTQSDLKLKQQLAMYEGEERESPEVGQSNGLEVN